MSFDNPNANPAPSYLPSDGSRAVARGGRAAEVGIRQAGRAAQSWNHVLRRQKEENTANAKKLGLSQFEAYMRQLEPESISEENLEGHVADFMENISGESSLRKMVEDEEISGEVASTIKETYLPTYQKVEYGRKEKVRLDGYRDLVNSNIAEVLSGREVISLQDIESAAARLDYVFRNEDLGEAEKTTVLAQFKKTVTDYANRLGTYEEVRNFSTRGVSVLDEKIVPDARWAARYRPPQGKNEKFPTPAGRAAAKAALHKLTKGASTEDLSSDQREASATSLETDPEFRSKWILANMNESTVTKILSEIPTEEWAEAVSEFDSNEGLWSGKRLNILIRSSAYRQFHDSMLDETDFISDETTRNTVIAEGVPEKIQDRFRKKIQSLQRNRVLGETYFYEELFPEMRGSGREALSMALAGDMEAAAKKAEGVLQASGVEDEDVRSNSGNFSVGLPETLQMLRESRNMSPDEYFRVVNAFVDLNKRTGTFFNGLSYVMRNGDKLDLSDEDERNLSAIMLAGVPGSDPENHQWVASFKNSLHPEWKETLPKEARDRMSELNNFRPLEIDNFTRALQNSRFFNGSHAHQHISNILNDYALYLATQENQPPEKAWNNAKKVLSDQFVLWNDEISRGSTESRSILEVSMSGVALFVDVFNPLSPFPDISLNDLPERNDIGKTDMEDEFHLIPKGAIAQGTFGQRILSDETMIPSGRLGEFATLTFDTLTAPPPDRSQGPLKDLRVPYKELDMDTGSYMEHLRREAESDSELADLLKKTEDDLELRNHLIIAQYGRPVVDYDDVTGRLRVFIEVETPSGTARQKVRKKDGNYYSFELLSAMEKVYDATFSAYVERAGEAVYESIMGGIEDERAKGPYLPHRIPGLF